MFIGIVSIISVRMLSSLCSVFVIMQTAHFLGLTFELCRGGAHALGACTYKRECMASTYYT